MRPRYHTKQTKAEDADSGSPSVRIRSTAICYHGERIFKGAEDCRHEEAAAKTVHAWCMHRNQSRSGSRITAPRTANARGVPTHSHASTGVLLGEEKIKERGCPQVRQWPVLADDRGSPGLSQIRTKRLLCLCSRASFMSRNPRDSDHNLVP